MADLDVSLILNFVDRATAPARKAIDRLAKIDKRSAEQRRHQLRRAGVEGAAVAGGVALAVREAMKLETAMTGVARAVDFKDPDGLLALRDDIRDVSNQSTLGADAVAGMVEQAGKMGVVGENLPDAEKREQLLAFAESANRMAVAFEVSADNAATYAVRLRNNWHLSGEAITSFGDTVNHLGNKMGTTEAKIMRTFNVIGTIPGIAGLSAKQTAALAAAVQETGQSAEQTSTGMKNFLMALTAGGSATKRQRDVLKQLGMDAEGLAEKMQVDAKGAIFDVADALGELPKAKRLSAVTDLVGREGVAGIATVTTNIDNLRAAFAASEDAQASAGGMNEEYLRQLGTTEAQLKLLTGKLGNLGGVIGNQLLPPLNELLDAISPVVEGMGDFAAANPRVTQGLLGVAGALTALRIAALAHPVVAVIAAITGAASLIYANWDGIAAYFTDRMDRIKQAFQVGFIDGVDAIIANFNPHRLMLDALDGIIEAVFGIDLSAAGARMMTTLKDGIWSVLTGMVDAIKAKLSAIVPDWMLKAWKYVEGGGDGPGDLRGAKRPNLGGYNDSFMRREQLTGSVPGRARGGDVRGGFPYLVGEEGRELFVPGASGRIVPARMLSLAAAASMAAAPSVAAGPLIAGLDRRPGLSAPAAGAGARVEVGAIHIHAAPGMDAEEIGRAVERKLAELARRGGDAGLHDGDLHDAG